MNIIEAQATYPDLFKTARIFAASQGVTMIGVRQGRYIKEIWVRNCLIKKLYREHGWKIKQAASDIVGVTPDYFERVIRRMKETEEKIKTTNWDMI